MAIPCKGCGRPIAFFGRTEKGALVPLVEARHLYEVDWNPNAEEYRALKVERQIYVSHFLDCPARAQFGNGVRAAPELANNPLVIKLVEALQNFENDDGHVPEAIWKLRTEALEAFKKERGDEPQGSFKL